MAQIAVTQLTDGPRNAVYHVAIVGDGSGNLVDVTIIDPAADFTPPGDANPHLRVCRLTYDLHGFNAWLEYDYLTSDTPVWTMAPNGAAEVCFERFGGLTDHSLMDGTGKLKLSTNGLAAGGRGTIIVEAKKS